jgi:hypothetical protein
MMIATMELLPAGVGRWPVVADLGPPGFFGGADLALIALLVYDRVTLGRFHRATVWGGAILVASQVIRVVHWSGDLAAAELIARTLGAAVFAGTPREV